MRHHSIWLVVAGILGACDVVGTVDETPNDPPPPVETGTFGVVAQPRLGTVVPGATSTAAITFAGIHERAGYEIAIQVLDNDGWVTFATAITADEPSSTDPEMHEWQVTAAPAQLSPRRWPQGGLLHVRVLGHDGEILTALFHDADACLDRSDNWRTRAAQCGVDLTLGITVVSPADPTANGATRPRYLDSRGWVNAVETTAYYQAIAAPTTLAAFRTQFALDVTPIASTYYNAGDLGIGREMQCQPQTDGGLACAVSNYGTFGGDAKDALDRAITGIGAFATVAMVYRPPLDAPNSVQFIVYGATGSLATTARLDTAGDNEAIPNNCLNCHGSTATYDPIAHQVKDARFLPWDMTTLDFSTRAGFRENEQEPNLRHLNKLVRDAATSEGVRELVDGWYAAGPPATDFTPAGWRDVELDRKVYAYVVSETCRGCHTSRDDQLSFTTSSAFRDHAASIVDSLCTKHAMPNAEVPLRRFWSGPARAYLAEYLGVPTCNP